MKTLPNLYNYYPEEFKSLTEEQLLMVENYLRQQDLQRDKEIAALKAQHRREINGHYFAVVPITLILVALSGSLFNGLFWSLFGALCACVLAVAAHAGAQSAYTAFIEKPDTKKGALVIKTIVGIIICLSIALCVNSYLYL